jgi:hypothetical protein
MPQLGARFPVLAPLVAVALDAAPGSDATRVASAAALPARVQPGVRLAALNGVLALVAPAKRLRELTLHRNESACAREGSPPHRLAACTCQHVVPGLLEFTLCLQLGGGPRSLVRY